MLFFPSPPQRMRRLFEEAEALGVTVQSVTLGILRIDFIKVNSSSFQGLKVVYKGTRIY